MGKSNRIRSEKAAAPVKSVSSKNAKNTKKDNSRLYTVIVAAIALFVAVMVTVTLIASSGILMRNTKAIRSDNYVINGNMLKYMFVSEYEEFLNTYSSYVTMFGLDTSHSLSEQTMGENASSLLGGFEGTWQEYFMSSVESQAKQLLIYCEEANKRGIELDEKDEKEIDDALASIESTAALYGYTTDSYLSLNYGKGMKMKDIRAAMEISVLASKCAEDVDAGLMSEITLDEINEKYSKNEREYNVVEYIYYVLSVDYDEVAAEVVDGYKSGDELTDEQKASVLEAYKQKIADAKAKAEVFEGYGDVDAFTSAVLDDVATTTFDALYESEALADADKLSSEALEKVKAAMIDAVISEVTSGAETTADDTAEADGVFTAYGETVTENAAKALDEIKADLFTAVLNAEDTYSAEKLDYDSEDRVSKWAFEEAGSVGVTTTITFGDGADDKEITGDSGYFDIAIYMLSATEYCDKTLAKNVAYMTFATADQAKKAIESFGTSAEKNLAAFESVAVSCSAVTNGTFENYLEGQLTYNGYEAWLYDEETVVGSYTETALANSATNATEYAIFFYYEEGDEAWYIDVKNAIFVDDYQQYYNTLTEAYPITVDEKVLGEIDI